MDLKLLSLISFLIPMFLVPLVMPTVVLMSNRKRLTDKPDIRKHQDKPVAVMGGTVVVVALAVTLIIENLFYNITDLFPVLCVMIILYVLGMLDDSLELDWKIKMVVMLAAILLLYFGGNYGVSAFAETFFSADFPMWISCLITLFVGLLLLNAVNFIDGIDGLASGLGIMTGAVIGFWNFFHGFTSHALLSWTMTGALLMFFIFNVFSNRYKMYLGDSGSLTLGLFVFISACPDYYTTVKGDYLVDHYFVSFLMALCSAMAFDLVRVVITRVFSRRSPFLPDRDHLHHVLVDMGMNHLMATMTIIFLNGVALLVWFVTAYNGMAVLPQFFIVGAASILLIWGPYFLVRCEKKRNPLLYSSWCQRTLRINSHFDKFVEGVGRLIDGRRVHERSHRAA